MSSHPSIHPERAVKPCRHLEAPVDIFFLSLGNECRNNATCHDLHMGYWCECLVPGYEGLLCERERDECTSWEPCQNGATCVDKFNGYRYFSSYPDKGLVKSSSTQKCANIYFL